jgi:hypothetical protein
MNLIITVALLLTLHPVGDDGPVNVKGIWIPKEIDWRMPQFETYCFVDDSTAVIISSMQRQKGDSILFNTDGTPSFHARFIYSLSKSQLGISDGRPAAGRKLSRRTVHVSMQSDKATLMIGDTPYVRAFLYTQTSKEEIYHFLMDKGLSSWQKIRT